MPDRSQVMSFALRGVSKCLSPKEENAANPPPRLTATMNAPNTIM